MIHSILGVHCLHIEDISFQKATYIYSYYKKYRSMYFTCTLSIE